MGLNIRLGNEMNQQNQKIEESRGSRPVIMMKVAVCLPTMTAHLSQSLVPFHGL